MRGAPNAHAVSIAWGPHQPFSLATSEAAIMRIEEDLAALSLRHNGVVVWPLNGIIPEFQSMPEELRQHLSRYARTLFDLSDPV